MAQSEQTLRADLAPTMTSRPCFGAAGCHDGSLTCDDRLVLARRAARAETQASQERRSRALLALATGAAGCHFFFLGGLSRRELAFNLFQRWRQYL